MKKRAFIILVVMAGAFFSCTKDFTQKNTDPTQFKIVSPEATIEEAVRALSNQLENYNMTKYWDLGNTVLTQTRYDVTDAGLWSNMYVGVLENLKQVEANYGKDSSFNNRVQIARIMECYAYWVLTGNFGAIALSQANNPNNLSTILFDSEDSAYSYILNTLKDAASRIKLNGDKLSYDVVYPGGTMLNWLKFANTFRLKVALMCMRNMGSLATSNIQDVMSNEANTISSATEAAKMNYENVTNNQSQYWIKYVFSGQYYPYTSTAKGVPPKMGDNAQAFFRSYNDPRMTVYFDSVPLATRYSITDTLTSTQDDSLRVVTYTIPYLGEGLAPGPFLTGWTNLTNTTLNVGGQNNADYSNIASSIITNPSRPFIMLSYAESEFLKAEAALLGYGGAQTPDKYYYAGIAANFAFWGIPDNQRNAYDSTDGIKWGTTGNGFNNYLGIVNFTIPQADINKVWVQEWVNNFPDGGFENWNLIRRTRFFVFSPEINPGGNSSYTAHPTYMDIPGRASYPLSVVTLNPNGYQSALTALGITAINDYNPDQQLKFALPFTIPNWSIASANYDLAYLRKWYGPTIQSLAAAAASGGFVYKVTLTYHP